MSIVIQKISTPFGEMVAGATVQGICLLEFNDPIRLAKQLAELEKWFKVSIISASSPFFILLKQQLDAYFKRQLTLFSIPLDIRGTPFQKQAWNALLQIPYAQTRSYQQQAKLMHKPNASRAVGNDNHRNRISILIPCHRVIAKDGTMAGYGGQIWRKKYLLDLEQGIKPKNKSFHFYFQG